MVKSIVNKVARNKVASQDQTNRDHRNHNKNSVNEVDHGIKINNHLMENSLILDLKVVTQKSMCLICLKALMKGTYLTFSVNLERSYL